MTVEDMQALQERLNKTLAALNPREWEAEYRAAEVMEAGAPGWDYLVLKQFGGPARIVLTQYQG